MLALRQLELCTNKAVNILKNCCWMLVLPKIYTAAGCSEWNYAQIGGNCPIPAVFQTLFPSSTRGWKKTWAVPKIEFRKLNSVLLEGSTKPWKSLTWEENPSDPDVLVFNISPTEKSYAERSCWSFVSCIRFLMIAGVLDAPICRSMIYGPKDSKGSPGEGEIKRVGSMWKKVAQPSLLPLPQTPSYWANCCSGRLLRQ